MKKLSILESLRGFATFYVALGHWFLIDESRNGPLSWLFKFGQESVILFFLLSGFVIFYARHRHPDESLRTYFIKRFRRIYFPLVCTMIFSLLFVTHEYDYHDILGNLLMLQDSGQTKPGNIVIPFMHNMPLWSLSYEWGFYMLFPFVFPAIKNSKYRVHIVGIFSLLSLIAYVIFPNHILLVFAYFIVWWTGLEMGEYFFGDKTRKPQRALILYYMLTLAVLGVETYHQHLTHTLRHSGFYPILLIRHFGFALVCMLLTFYLTAATKKALQLLKPFALLAPVSYCIYVLHFPILTQIEFNMPAYASITCKIALLGALAWLIEMVLQPRINKLIK